MDSVWTRQFGEARIAVISEATGWWPMERALADVPEEMWRRELETSADDCLPIGFNLGLITVPGASILVDTGFGEYDPTDPRESLVSVRHMELGEKLDTSLAALEVKPAEITHVLITHMHGDHILGATRTVDGRRIPAFPNARYYVTAAEWASAPAWHQNAAAINAQKDALVAADAVELTEGDRSIVPGVDLLLAPGESPGHAIVRVAAGGDVVYFIGDLYHYPAEFAHVDWIPLYRDRYALVGTRLQYLPRFVREDAWLIPAHHEFPAIGKVRATESGYWWEPLSE